MKKVGYQRWIKLPFSFGCSSQSSVAVAAATDSNNATPTRRIQGRQKDSSSIIKKDKYLIGFSLHKRNITRPIQTLIQRIKNVSQFFVCKNESEHEEEEEEMEIGYPTDVKHLIHIGWDGSTTITNSTIQNWGNSTPSHGIGTFPSISLKQFELAMESQAQGNVPSKQPICSESKS